MYLLTTKKIKITDLQQVQRQDQHENIRPVSQQKRSRST